MSIPRHLKAARLCFERTGSVKLSDVCTSNVVEQFFSALRSLGGTHERNPSTVDADIRAGRLRDQSMAKLASLTEEK